MTSKVSLDKSKIKFVLLEGVHQSALDTLHAAGYTNIDYYEKALDGDDLKEAIKEAHFVGLRSRTHLTAEMIAAAPKLIAIGCFCIGTNQVDLNAAKARGIPVFNAPFSNTRSVAELVLGEILLLMRNIPQANADVHRGLWNKSAVGSHEVRGKNWVLLVMAISVRSSVLLRNHWVWMCIFMILKTNFLLVTPSKYVA
ncbi:D-3-phosphoglycerate dehydrogenase [Aggregatibacter aphrophilus]|uniref:D-3-phosphoglycerate dehydrogenase n=1 Tax=Aggregatibacter aphrophilus TaxID=732 RepID=A0A336N6Y3_AGGAP|nr:D-3-phosphoglycerate dehydrogenase [Aggregatibacter aphrophilus]